jgi:peptidoglycan/LPS O-acetylase OafA/YrhL
MGWSTHSSIIVTTLGVIAASALLTYLIERPAQRAIRAWWRRRETASQPAAAV